jgi:hypothetical protein
MTVNVTFGADPEFFVAKIAKTDKVLPVPEGHPDYYAYLARNLRAGKPPWKAGHDVVPICGLLGGTKDKPIPIPGLGEGFMMQEDGVAAEFNIPPTNDPHTFVVSIDKALSHICKQLRRKSVDSVRVNCIELKEDWITSNAAIKQIGCDPDFCAYDANPNIPRELAEGVVGLTRGAGGHIHIGYPTELCPQPVLVQLLDAVVGLSMLPHDKQGKRRVWWGKAGIFRVKPYGIEYRTLSNFWIWSPHFGRHILWHIKALLNSLEVNNVAWQAFWNGVNWTQIQDAINTEDTRLSDTVMKSLRDRFPIYRQVFNDAAALAMQANIQEVPMAVEGPEA